MKICKIMMLSALIALPLSALSAENQTLTLKNQSDSSKGYYLVQDKTLGEPGCVNYLGNKEIKPGESTSFEIKKDCKWGVVIFKIFSLANKEYIGDLGQAYRDGKVIINISSKCKNNDCTFKDLNPQQQ